MGKINSLQGRVLDAGNQGVSRTRVVIECRDNIASSTMTDGDGYFVDNNIKDKYIDQPANSYQVIVGGAETEQYDPRPPLQSSDADQSTDANNNQVNTFPMKIYSESAKNLRPASRGATYPDEGH